MVICNMVTSLGKLSTLDHNIKISLASVLRRSFTDNYLQASSIISSHFAFLLNPIEQRAKRVRLLGTFYSIHVVDSEERD